MTKGVATPLYLRERGRGEGFRISDLDFRFVSDFEIRISDFPSWG